MSEDSQELTEETTELEETQDVTPETPTPATADSVDQLPDWAQKIVRDLRSENAKNRKEKQAAAKEAEALAQKQAEEQGEFKRLYEEEKAKRVEAEVAKQAAELAGIREKVGRELGVPAALVTRLQGETEDEIRLDAESIIAALPQPQVNASNDASAGQNQQQSIPAKTDEEIKEFAVKYGVNYEIAKQQLLTQ